MSKSTGKPLIQSSFKKTTNATRLPFSVLPPSSQSRDQSSGNTTADTSSKQVEKPNEKQLESEYDLSEFVNLLSVRQKPSKEKATKPQCHHRRHNEIKQEEMIRCTAITKGDQQCDLSFCWKCLSDNYSESAEALGQTQGAYVTAEGRKINHVAGKDVTWACPKCRGICTCKACIKNQEERESSGSRSIMSSFLKHSDASTDVKTPSIASVAATPKPPILYELELKYPEEVIWQRLQIREFVFRFEHLLQLTLDDRAQLQDTEGDWVTNGMLKKLACSMLELIALHGVENSQANSIQKQALRFLKDELVVSSRPYLSRKHWQDLSEMLCGAGYEEVPAFADEPDPIEAKSEVQMDWLPSFVTRSMQANGMGPMTLINDGLDQLKVINMLSVCTLCTPCIRNDLLHGFEQVKEEEKSLQNDRRQYMYEDMHARTTRNTLLQRLDQASGEASDEGTAGERVIIQQQLEMLDKECDERRKRLGRKEVDYFLLNKRTCKRTESAGTDQIGNEYWLFGDMNPDKDNDTGACWGRGVVIVGPGIGGHHREEDKACVAMLTANPRRWWYLTGSENIDRLVHWLDHHSEPKELFRQLSTRSRYNSSLSKT